ncbi:hypothetical protein LRD18_00990 [Halorhodospira halochloris]|uniref:hypothetical protein n=1 Tax=Halorhodospira halochloris TaxID=1052 RepID=UPI001EE78676|nr:hypothetical protein [Halorhodospira halochloris]MCG5529447.1 hypothetical protein [Halorhodospira halochloris]
MQYDRVIKGALVATMGSVLAIGAGNVMADVHENATDSDSFDVELNVFEPISVEVSEEADLPEAIVEGDEASDDYTFSVSGEDEADFTYWTEHRYDADEGLDLNEGVSDGSGEVGEDDIDGTLTVEAEEAGEYEITVEATAEYDL